MNDIIYIEGKLTDSDGYEDRFYYDLIELLRHSEFYRVNKYGHKVSVPIDMMIEEIKSEFEDDEPYTNPNQLNLFDKEGSND